MSPPDLRHIWIQVGPDSGESTSRPVSATAVEVRRYCTAEPVACRLGWEMQPAAADSHPAAPEEGM
jgi:hypothetical protein